MKDLQLDFFDIPSPCRGVCKSDSKGYCQGCFRTRDERFGWIDFTKTEKQKVIKLCLQREKRRNKPKKTLPIVINNDDDPSFVQPSLLEQASSTPIDTDVHKDDFNDFEL